MTGNKEQGFLSLPARVIKNRKLVGKLAVNDFRTRYAGSHFGTIWAFIQPVVTIFVYWLIFGPVGFKSGTSYGVPFVVYLVCGIIPWFYTQELMVGGTNTLFEYSYLVKKVVFDFDVLPFVKAASATFVHGFFILVAVVIAALYGYFPSVYLLQLLYYFPAMFLFLIGIVYGCCAVVVFFRDLSQIVSIFLQVAIWSVPIMFDPDASFAESKWAWIFKINPFGYIVNGYRDAIYGRVWFWEKGWYAAYFWGWTIVLLLFGNFVFRKLKPHFADVL